MPATDIHPDYTLHTLEERIIIYADRLVDIITDGMVRTEPEAEERFEEILATNVRYGKNQTTLGISVPSRDPGGDRKEETEHHER